MPITLDLPDELVQHFNRDDLSRDILKVLVVQAYQAEKSRNPCSVTANEFSHLSSADPDFIGSGIAK
jgi:hypothetical protein